MLVFIYHESTLQELLLTLSKSKKINDVLSFVRNDLASLNNQLAIFSAECSPSAQNLSLACAIPEAFRHLKMVLKNDIVYKSFDKDYT